METTALIEPLRPLRLKRLNEGRLIEELHFPRKCDGQSSEHSFKTPINVKVLWLNSNRLRDIPSNVLSACLRELHIDNNFITSFPTELTRCKFLEVLSAKGNLITNLSFQIPILDKLKYLKVLILAGNPIEDAPAYRAKMVARLSSLEYFDHVKVTENERSLALAADGSNLSETGRHTQSSGKISPAHIRNHSGRQSEPLAHPAVPRKTVTFAGFSALEKEIWQRAEALSLSRSKKSSDRAASPSASREARVTLAPAFTSSLLDNHVSFSKKGKKPRLEFAVDISTLTQSSTGVRCVVSEMSAHTESGDSLLQTADDEKRRTYPPVSGDAENVDTSAGPLTTREKDLLITICSQRLLAWSSRDKQGGMQFPVSSECLRSLTEFLDNDGAGIGKIPLNLHGAIASPAAVSKTSPRNSPVETVTQLSSGAVKGPASPTTAAFASSGRRQPAKGCVQFAKAPSASENATAGTEQGLTAQDVLERLLSSPWVKLDKAEVQKAVDGAYLDAQMLLEEGKEAEAVTSALLALRLSRSLEHADGTELVKKRARSLTSKSHLQPQRDRGCDIFSLVFPSSPLLEFPGPTIRTLHLQPLEDIQESTASH